MINSTIRLQSFMAKSISPDSVVTRLFLRTCCIDEITVPSHDDDRLVIQRLSVSARGTEHRYELSARRFGGANVRPIFSSPGLMLTYPVTATGALAPFTLAPETRARRSCHRDKSDHVHRVPKRLSVRAE